MKHLKSDDMLSEDESMSAIWWFLFGVMVSGIILFGIILLAAYIVLL